MTSETQGPQEQDPDDIPYINDPGNEDPGSGMEDEPEALPDDPDDPDIAGDDGSSEPG